LEVIDKEHVDEEMLFDNGWFLFFFLRFRP